MSFNRNQSSHQALRSILAEKTGKVVAWTGSGLSTDAGLPTWPKLKERLVSQLKEKSASIVDADSGSLCAAAKRAAQEKNYWIAFDILHQNLGTTSFRSAIRESLRPALTSECPPIYKYIWKLKVAGVLNLNLDRLATKALGEVSPGTLPIEFDGRRAGNFLHSLKTPRPFVANLHGIAEDTSSWVFTKPDLRRLLIRRDYKTFIDSCLSTTTILFIGISADDIAAGGHLENLTKSGCDVGSHYWLTNRTDLRTDRWAEKSGIQLIRYQNHSDIIEFFDDILKFVPTDDASVPPVFLQDPVPVDDQHLSSPEELSKLPAETIRAELNTHATKLLNEASPDRYTRYEKFSTKYDEAIYRAWYTSVDPPRNRLIGYTLKEQVGQGAFGRVYRAFDPGGHQVAIKVLLEEIRREKLLLQSFRRGVRSMQFLLERDVDGMVAYRKASEIPAFVVMDWVEGPSLSDACLAHQIKDWGSILKVGLQMADVIYRAHNIPERVLHRDIRPSNIMLEGFYTKAQQWRVVVLDFDLSWHQGALERSVVRGALAGYLAPEQIQATQGTSTRHAAVDSFGVGMTLYFMVSGTDPVPEQHQHMNWKEVVQAAALAPPRERWMSLPYRYARLITRATQHIQSNRWDMSQIRDELSRLYDTYRYPRKVKSAELVAEEIVAGIGRTYEWDDDRVSATVTLASGVLITVVGDESRRRIGLEVTWSSSGQQERKQVGKWMRTSGNRCIEILRGRGWRITAKAIDLPQSMVIGATISVSAAAQTLPDQTDMLSTVVDELIFE